MRHITMEQFVSSQTVIESWIWHNIKKNNDNNIKVPTGLVVAFLNLDSHLDHEGGHAF